MAKIVNAKIADLKQIRTVDPRLVSYNIEMTEVTGGTFWKAYTKGQMEGTEKFPIMGYGNKKDLMQYFPPIDLANERIRKLAKELGSAWIRVSGTWSTTTYYDFEGTTNGVAPEGYQSVLTREQWLNLLDFVKAMDGKLLISVANCEGIHSAHEPWNPSQAEKIFKLSQEYGVPIAAAEFMNEPNLLSGSGAPKGYTFEDFIRDQDIFNEWLHKNWPGVLAVGPSSVGGGKMGKMKLEEGLLKLLSKKFGTEICLKGSKEKMDVFSYHYYNGVSERITASLSFVHWPVTKAHTDEYLEAAGYCARAAAVYRDKYMPGAQMWVTESGDAGGGGCTWASTYLDVLRTLNELGEFATISDGIVFHNTLASSDYGWLKHGTFEPRPTYFAVLLWNQLMGTTVYDSEVPISEGAHVFCHSRKDGQDGCVWLVINNSLTNTTKVELPKEATVYALAGKDGIRSKTMTLNGRELVLGEHDELPNLQGETVTAGTVEVDPGSCTFFVL